MPSCLPKKLLILLFLLAFSARPCPAQALLLQQADSLFASKQYSRAGEIYEQLQNRPGMASPSLYLRLAFIHQSAGEYAQALYYLSLCEQLAPSLSLMQAQEQLSRQYQVSGYAITDASMLRMLYKQYAPYLAVGGLGACLLLLGFWLRRKRAPSGGEVSGAVILIIALGLLINLELPERFLILRSEVVPLHTAPAAGSPISLLLFKGNRLRALRHTDVWWEVSWEGQRYFIHQRNGWSVGF